ncbi:NAD(P)/FAD-dependent oxidoreductase [Proteiniphilum sp. UBA1028]|mgnify:CR=1 FL=1|jgi:NADH dehydrogenase|uniref:NAD(P)/FAD-dependent oxidoreductase n=1 Tax=Proteiniphilum sp. UBA1028 TaxID=1947251 RepID=UPI000E85DF5F|nr:NAD(P)/FAD-dependent oxidoreductase [Proteiniphilum sp. UBA1028]HBG57797.1 FAD-dependent oxidoreductase [Porphyromonadaceae bacterium]
MKKIVVAGCGFGGLQFIRHLKKGVFDIMVIDKINHHQFPPLFYQVAASQIEPATISFPIRKIFQKRRDVRIRLAQVLSVNDAEKYVDTTIGQFHYDYLVIATGTRTNFYGNVQTEKHALGLKSTYQSINVRNFILHNFEKLLYTDEKEGLYNIVIVGGGATGVELAGAFAEMTKEVLPKDYPNIDSSKVHVYLLEGGEHTLSAMSSFAQNYSERQLRSMGVIVKTNTLVKEYDGELLTLNNGETIHSRNVIWSAGVTGNSIEGIPEEARLRTGRIKVDRFNRVDGLRNVFAIGDVAYMETEKYPRGHPQLANVAIGQGKNLARNLQRMEKGYQELKLYEYRNLGTMATIGRNKAVVDLPFVKFKGRFAWFIWMFLHLMLILSVRNKLVVFINWAWNYFTKNNSLRLILKDTD